MPSNRRSLLGQRVLDLITEDWQSVDDLMEKAIPLVPPGRALRVWQDQRATVDAAYAKRVAEGKATGKRKPIPSPADQERQGARAVINHLLGGLESRSIIDVEAVGGRLNRRVRLSQSRQFSHHCCMHGGSCRGDVAEPVPEEDIAPPEEVDALDALIKRVMESRERRLDVTPQIREVYPGEIDRLLREAG